MQAEAIAQLGERVVRNDFSSTNAATASVIGKTLAGLKNGSKHVSS